MMIKKNPRKTQIKNKKQRSKLNRKINFKVKEIIQLANTIEKPTIV